MTKLVLSFLGTVRVTLDNLPSTDFAYAKVLALLAYLSVEANRAHRREALAELLWPDQPESVARSNVRQTLFRLRKAIGDHAATPPFLLVTHETVQFNAASDSEVDVTAFAGLVASCLEHPHQDADSCDTCARQLEKAVTFYGGPFLDQLIVDDSVAFEDWARVKQQWLHGLALSALYRLTAYYTHQGSYERARQTAWRQLELEPWREEAHRQLMNVLILSGERSAALAQYERCRQILADELNVEPAPETTALYQSIRNQPAAPSESAPERLPNTGSHRLPVQTTPFVGRVTELAELAERLADPACRLLTLTGLGGIGKTRLALQVAVDQVQRFVDGVYFVSLSSVNSPKFLVATILDALGYASQRQEDLTNQLLACLQEKSILLLMDNFEHLLEGVDLLSEILNSAAGVKIITTSRERLGLVEEWLFPVQQMNFPRRDESGGIEGYDAIKLFLQQARRVQPGFSLAKAGDRKAAIQICQLAEGMPLGIELAAAWLRAIPPQQVAGRMAEGLDFMVASTRNMPERHRSMRALFEHSWNLLSAAERSVLMKLSVFRGGFTLEAAKAVTGASIAGMVALIDKSLVRPEQDGRYDMHELLRQFACEKLENAAEAESVKTLHLGFFQRLAQTARPMLETPEQGVWLHRLNQEYPNSRAALRWAVESGTIESGLRLGVGLWLFWFMRGYLTEGREHFADLLAAAGADVPTAAYTEALDKAGVLARYQGDYVNASLLARQALTICRNRGDKSGIANSLANLGFVTLHQGNFTDARSLYTDSLALNRELENQQGIADSLSHLALMAFYEGDYVTARHLDEESLTLWRVLGDQQGIAWALHRLGNVILKESGPVNAYPIFAESLAIAKPLEYQWGLAWSLEDFARLAALKEAFEQALCLAGAATSLRKAINMPLPLPEQADLDRLLIPAWRALGNQAATTIWTCGQSMPLEQAIAAIDKLA